MNLDLIYFFIGAVWVTSLTVLANQFLRNYSTKDKLKYYFGFSFSLRRKIGSLVLKELVKPSRRNKDYMLLINIARISSFLVLITVIYEIFGLVL
ncbi:MAG: hypothetical protein Q8R47_04615 [Nanoarchaeota archaeon]|nr:hypothetical protein [Nanoarchaeota archaeon]